jgi:hypothetical protein
VSALNYDVQPQAISPVNHAQIFDKTGQIAKSCFQPTAIAEGFVKQNFHGRICGLPRMALLFLRFWAS